MDWRPPQIADFVRMSGTGRYAPSQSVQSCLADLRRLLDEVEQKYPGLKSTVTKSGDPNRPGLLPFEVPRSARIVRTLNRAYEAVRGRPQPAGPVRPCCFYGTDAAHFAHLVRMEGYRLRPGRALQYDAG